MMRRGLTFVLAVLLAALPMIGRAQTAPAEEKKPSGPTFTPYGFLLLNAYFNSRAFAGNDYPDFAGARAATSDALFLMEARAARIGIRIGLGEAVGAQLAGVLEGDFLATLTPNNTKIEQYGPRMRMRLAYGTATWRDGDNSFRLLMGQDYGLVNPLFANTIAWITTPLFQFAGNAYIRSPQLQARADIGKDNGFTLAVAAMDPMDQNPQGNAANQVTATLGPGNRARWPQFDGRAAVRYKADPGLSGEVGVGGSFHRERYLNTTTGKNLDVDATLAGVDALLRFPFVELRGEGYLATNQDTYFLHLGQGGVNITNATGSGATTGVASASNRRTKGGWAQVIVTPIPYFQLAAGYGVEIPNNKDIRPITAATRLRNSIASLEAIFILSKNWKAGVGWANTVTTTARVGSGASANTQLGITNNDGYQTVASTQFTF
jgi:hypothetical protein